VKRLDDAFTILLVLLAVLFALMLIFLISDYTAEGASQGFTSLPQNNNNFVRDSITFSSNEHAEYMRRILPFGLVYGGGTPSGSGTLTTSVQALDAIGVDGHAITQPSTVITLTGNRRTYLYADSQDSRAPEVTAAGGSGCTFKSRYTRLVLIECSIGSLSPTLSTSLLPLYFIDTDATHPTSQTDKRPLGAQYPYMVRVTDYGAKCDGATDDTSALNAAFQGVPIDPSGFKVGVVLVPPGACVITGQVFGQSNTILQGAGRGRSSIQYNGTSNLSMLGYIGASHFAVRDVSFVTLSDAGIIIHLVIRDSVYWEVNNVSSFSTAPGLANKNIGIRVECTTPGQIPSRGFGNIHNYLYTATGNSAFSGSRGIDLDGSGPCSTDGIKYVRIDGETNIEDAEIGLHLNVANFNSLDGDSLLQGNSTGIKLEGSSTTNRFIGVRYQQNTIHNNIDGTSCNNMFIQPSITSPSTFGTFPANCTSIVNQIGTILYSSVAGMWDFRGTPNKDGWVRVYDDFVPTTSAMVDIDRGSQTAKDPFRAAVNGATGLKVQVSGCVEITGAQAQLGSCIKWHKSQQIAVTWGGPIPAQNTGQATVTFTGAVVGDSCVPTPYSALNGGLVGASCQVLGPDTVTLTIGNVSTSAITPNGITWNFDLWRH
jgi:hypothetical protein